MNAVMPVDYHRHKSGKEHDDNTEKGPQCGKWTKNNK